MWRRYVVIDIGCLECWHYSSYVGTYRSVAKAKAANPGALTVREQSAKGWRGEGVMVIFDTRRKGARIDMESC